MTRSRIAALACAVGLAACTAHEASPARPTRSPARAATTLTIIGTNDLHGAIDRLPILGGFLANLRAARAADGGGVVLVDAGDLFQGTLESNTTEGAAVVAAYNLLGYDAAAIGNHEFDYGPVGPAATPRSPTDDPRGALEAAMRAAHFPFLSANIVATSTHALPPWPGAATSTIIERAGVPIGIIGASTESTPRTTMAANFVGLAMTPAAAAIREQATALRARGARVIIVVAHFGSRCRALGDPADDSSCDHDSELYQVVRALPRGTVDVIVAGHTHAGVAHVIDGVAVIESYSSGRAFGRVDLSVAPDGAVRAVQVSPPHELCPRAGRPDDTSEPAPSCNPGDYEGRPVIADRGVGAVVAEAVERARAKRSERLGTAVALAPIHRSYDRESALGDLVTDLMLAASPAANIAMTNGGGIRADLPAGPVTYGAVYEALPFDNQFTRVELTGAQLRHLIARNLTAKGHIYSWSGLAVAHAHCDTAETDGVAMAISVGHQPLQLAKTYVVATSDYLASGGDSVLQELRLPDHAIQPTDVLIREAVADQLRALTGAAAQLDPAAFTRPAAKRLDFAGERPLACAPAGRP